MNPCDTQWSAQLDESRMMSPERCELCGGVIHDDSARTPSHMAYASNWLMRFAERLLFGGYDSKGIGSMILVIAAKLLNPQASIAGIAAATGLSKDGARSVIDRVHDVAPDVHNALWGARALRSDRGHPRQGTYAAGA